MGCCRRQEGDGGCARPARRRAGGLGPWLLAAWLLVPSGARAAPRDESAEPAKPKPAKSAKKQPAQEPARKAAAKSAKKPRKKPNRYEWGLLPELSFSSDTGVGFGFLGSLARYRKGYWPYGWRLKVGVSMSAKKMPDSGRVELPVHSHKVTLDLPGLWRRRLRISFTAAFRQALTVGYYGIGNASQKDAERVAECGRYHQYKRRWPSAGGRVKLRLLGKGRRRLEAFFSVYGGYNWIELWRPGDRDVPEGFRSKLEEDRAGASGEFVRKLLVGTEPHGYLTFDVGLSWDSRNHETAPYHGMWHDLAFRSGVGLDLPYGYSGVTGTARFYESIYREYLVVAARFTVDLLFGRPPFYALAGHGGLSGGGTVGGGKSVRGVAGQRYAGKIKVLGNLELRTKVLPFRIKSHHFSLGAVAFLDAGRVWADYKVRRELDGSDVDTFGLKVGLGGGLRLQWGEDFLIVADFAYSPTEGSTGIYIDAYHAF